MAKEKFELLLECASGLRRSQVDVLSLEQVSVDFREIYDRKPHPEAVLEASIEQIWNQRCTANPSLYNATKFRYEGHRVSGAKDHPVKVCLHLGLTDYKTFVGTNLSPKWEDFLTSDTDVARCKHASSPLGNGAVVETTDSRILVLQRSSNVGEFPGHLVFPGGHSEPLVVGINGHLHNTSHALKQKLNEGISDEMFHGIIREVCEETGVPAASLSEAVFIGISRRIVNVRPTAFFYIQCHMSSKEVLQHYHHAIDAFESTKLCFISKEDLISQAEKMPGCHQGGAALFTKMKSVHI